MSNIQYDRMMAAAKAKLNVVGMTESDALALLRANGVPVRILQRGDDRFELRSNYRPSRCNLYLDANGRVTRAMHDGDHQTFPSTDFCDRVYFGMRNSNNDDQAEWLEVFSRPPYAAAFPAPKCSFSSRDSVLADAISRTGLDRLVGMTESDAEAVLKANNLTARVLQRGNEMFGVRDDYRLNRCNMIVDADGRVSSVMGDGGRPFLDLDTFAQLFLRKDLIAATTPPPDNSAIVSAHQLVGWTERDATARLSALGATYQVRRCSHNAVPSRIDPTPFHGVTLYVNGDNKVFQASSTYGDKNNSLLPPPAAAATHADDVDELELLVGMCESEAVRVLQKCGAVARITQRGAERFAGTQNICWNRCNLRVDNAGWVVSAEHDLGDAFPDAHFRAFRADLSKHMTVWRNELRSYNTEQQMQRHMANLQLRYSNR